MQNSYKEENLQNSYKEPKEDNVSMKNLNFKRVQYKNENKSSEMEADFFLKSLQSDNGIILRDYFLRQLLFNNNNKL